MEEKKGKLENFFISSSSFFLELNGMEILV
jgi:hypothetical protein